MNFIKKIDDLVLGQIERFTHWFQNCFGKNNFWMAGCLINFCVVGTTIWLFFLHKDRLIDNDYLVRRILLSAGIYFFCGLSIVAAQKMMPMGNFKNPGALRNKYWRVSFLFFWIWLSMVYVFSKMDLYSVSGVDLVHGFCLSALEYLVACTPKPPSKSKFKDWIKNIFQLKRPVPAPAR